MGWNRTRPRCHDQNDLIGHELFDIGWNGERYIFKAAIKDGK